MTACMCALGIHAQEPALEEFAKSMASADSAHIQEAVNALVKKAEVDAEAYSKLADEARLVLFEEDSPSYNESLYRYFVMAFLSGNKIDDASRSRYEFQLEMIDKNAPGTAVSDFRVIDREDAERSLTDIVAGRPALLVFYDPDCEDCHEAFAKLASMPVALALVEEGKLGIVAIADFDTRERWEEEALDLPDGWIDCCDVTGIQDEDLYIITHTPTFYWVGADGRIELKNRGLNEMIGRMQSLCDE